MRSSTKLNAFVHTHTNTHTHRKYTKMGGGTMGNFFSSLCFSYFSKLFTISRYLYSLYSMVIESTDFGARLPGSRPGPTTSCGDIKQMT